MPTINADENHSHLACSTWNTPGQKFQEVKLFFQAEDGIRDRDVTGVQTCALPILEDEPHTVLEDAQFYEAPILTKILESVTRKQLMELGR